MMHDIILSFHMICTYDIIVKWYHMKWLSDYEMMCTFHIKFAYQSHTISSWHSHVILLQWYDIIHCYMISLSWYHTRLHDHGLITCHIWIFFSPAIFQLFSTEFQVFATPPSIFATPPLFFRRCLMFAQGLQSHVSSVDVVTLRHTQPKSKHLAMDWANQTASDGVRQAHGMPPMERTQLSQEQSECLFGQRAGI